MAHLWPSRPSTVRTQHAHHLRLCTQLSASQAAISVPGKDLLGEGGGRTRGSVHTDGAGRWRVRRVGTHKSQGPPADRPEGPGRARRAEQPALHQGRAKQRLQSLMHSVSNVEEQLCTSPASRDFWDNCGNRGLHTAEFIVG